VKSAPKAKGPPLRRDYSFDFKLKIVRETLMPGAPASVVARRHDLNSNMLFRWRREYKNGELRGRPTVGSHTAAENHFVPVGVVDCQGGLVMLPAPEKGSAEEEATTPKPAPAGKTSTSGVIEIVLPSGIRLRVGAHVDDQTLRRVLTVIQEIA
jgi:transposase